MATEVPEVEAASQDTLEATSASEITLESASPSSEVELTNIKLKTKASAMQKELSSILTSVKDIKNRCAMLQVENRRLQEYIESFTMEK